MAINAFGRVTNAAATGVNVGTNVIGKGTNLLGKVVRNSGKAASNTLRTAGTGANKMVTRVFRPAFGKGGRRMTRKMKMQMKKSRKNRR